jgi:hypothetical protein
MPVASITEVITTFAEAEAKFSLQRTDNPQFFTEWNTDLPILDSLEKIALDRIRQRYLYHRNKNKLLEETIKLIVVSPLLELAGLYDPPFELQTEVPVELVLDNNPEEVLRGRIDALVIYERPQETNLWVIILESKRSEISIWTALPQALAYAMANPKPDIPSFIVLTNGDETIFGKIYKGLYDVSDGFSMIPLQNRLYQVMAILKKFKMLMTND